MMLHVFSVDLVKTSTLLNPGLELSTSFVECSDKQLSIDFVQRTGIPINKKICITFGTIDFFLQIAETSTMKCSVIIGSYGNPSTIHWKSKSGKIYSPQDEIDCDDVTFWFGELNTPEFLKQLAPSVKQNLNLRGLTYTLDVQELNMDMEVTMQLKPDTLKETNKLIDEIGDMINDYNNSSMKNNRDVGVVHNARFTVEDSKILATIDTGSAGMLFLKKFLQFLSKLDAFKKVTLN